MTMKTIFSSLKPARLGLRIAESAGLIVIAIATIIAGVLEVVRMIDHGKVDLADLLLLFLYLEVLAMVLIYMESHQLPVRLPMYIAIVALARYLIIDIKELSEWRILAVGGAILLVAASVLIIRYGHVRWPYPEGEKDASDPRRSHEPPP